jgi:hypothetical protein
MDYRLSLMRALGVVGLGVVAIACVSQAAISSMEGLTSGTAAFDRSISPPARSRPMAAFGTAQGPGVQPPIPAAAKVQQAPGEAGLCAHRATSNLSGGASQFGPVW